MAKSKENTELAVISPDLKKNLEIIQSLKLTVDEIGLNCMQIKVMDESTLSIGQQNLSKANQIAKSIEEKRKAIKAPYLDAGKLIDKTCNDLVAQVEKGIEHIKLEIKNWEEAKRSKEKEAQDEIERQLAETRALQEADEARKKEITDYINLKALPNLKHYYNTAITAELCDKNVEFIEKNFPPASRFKEFAQQAFELRDQYINLIKTKKQQFASVSAAELELIKQKEALELEKAKLAEKEAELKAIEEKAAALKLQQEAEANALAEKEKLQAQAELEKTKNVRSVWRYEIENKMAIPMDWLVLDDSKVKEYIKQNKDVLRDGQWINGIKFYKDITIVA